MKKKVSLFTIIFVILSAIIAILALFNVLKIKGAVSDLLFTSLTLAVAGLLTINSCTMLERKNKLAIVSLSLISASALLVIISLWSNAADSDLYNTITLIACILSVCFNLITSNILKLQNRYLGLQIPSYICFAVVSIFLISASLGSDFLSDNLRIFILFIILSLVAMGILAVFSKKQTAELNNDIQYIKISKKEYEELMAIKVEYERLKENKND